MPRYARAAQSTLVITILTIIAGFLGFFQQTITAYVFGAGRDVDAFVAARTVPDIFTKILQVGILSIVFVPIFVKYLQKKEEGKAWEIAINLFNIITTFFVIVVIVGMILTPFVVKILVPGFDAATQKLTIYLAWILLPGIIFNILTILGTSILHAFKKFAVPALIKLILPIIISVLLFVFRDRFGVYLLSAGFLVVAILEFLVIFAALYKQGLRYRPLFHWRDPVIKKMIILVYPFLFATILAEASTVVNRALASGLSEGSLSALYYAERVMKFASQIFLFAIPVVSFPTFAEKIARREFQQLRHAISLTIRIILFMIIPTSIGLIILRVPVVALLFQRGEFDSQDTQATAFALGFFMLGVFATGITNILANVFYGLERTKILVKITLVVITLNIILNFILVRYLQAGGLALATSLTNILSLIFHSLILAKYLPKIRAVFWQKYYWRLLLPSLFMGCFTYFAFHLLSTFWPAQTLWQQIVNLGITILGSAGLYLIFAYLLKLQEMHLALDFVRAKLGKIYAQRNP